MVGKNLDSCTCTIWGYYLGIHLCRKMGDADLCDETLVDSKWKRCAVLNDCLITTSLPQRPLCIQINQN